MAATYIVRWLRHYGSRLYGFLGFRSKMLDWLGECMKWSGVDTKRQKDKKTKGQKDKKTKRQKDKKTKRQKDKKDKKTKRQRQNESNEEDYPVRQILFCTLFLKLRSCQST